VKAAARLPPPRPNAVFVGVEKHTVPMRLPTPALLTDDLKPDVLVSRANEGLEPVLDAPDIGVL
jgi:hypothetical protein